MQKGDVKKASALMMVTVFAGFLTVFTLGYFTVMPDRESYFENRTLAEAPELGLNELASGEFSQQLEKYLSDHILFRNDLVTMSTDLNYLLGRRSQQYVYHGSGGRLFLRFFENDQAVERLCSEYNSFAETVGVPVDYMLIPSSGFIYSDLLPAGTDCVECEEHEVGLIRDRLDSSIGFMFMGDTLKQLADSGVETHLRTDHHWTIYAANAALESYLDAIGRERREVGYEKGTITGYYGPLFAVFPSYTVGDEEIDYLYDPNGQYTVEQPLTGETENRVIFTEKQFAPYKYGVFLDCDKAFRHIHNDNAPKGSIMVVKDSFGLAFMTLLADQYSDIYAVDVRHYDSSRNNNKRISELCREVGAERVLILNMTYSVINSEMFGLS